MNKETNLLNIERNIIVKLITALRFAHPLQIVDLPIKSLLTKKIEEGGERNDARDEQL